MTWIWAGILLRCINIIGDVVVFRMILGFSFRERKFLVAGVVWGIFAVVFPELPLDFNLPLSIFDSYPELSTVIQMNLMVIFMYATLFILFRNLRFWLVVAYNQAEACIHYFILGMISLLLKMDPWGAANDIYLLNLFGNLIFLILSFSFGMAVRKRRDAIHERLKQIKQQYYFLFFILFTIPVFTYTNSSTRPQDVARTNAIDYLLNGFSGTLVVAVTVLVIVLLFQKRDLRKMIQLNQRCIEEQKEQYLLLNQKQEEMRKFRHDSNAHMKALQALARKEGAKKTEEYTERLIGIQKEIKHLNTCHVIGDAVLNQYYGEGLKLGIEVKLMGQFSENLNVSETDLCVILTNAVSNAFEAACRCGEGSVITVTLTQYRDIQFIRISNPTVEKPQIKDGVIRPGTTTKEDKRNHGLGVMNILDGVRRCNGSVEWRYKEAQGENKAQVVTEIQLPLTVEH